ncbi:MAG: menaquinone biosynthesis family protein [Gemmatimonadaceae bacterium]
MTTTAAGPATSPRTIHVAHSPDSDDAFMFYALAERLIDTGGIEYVHELQDIETLNQRAMRAELEVTAVSIHAYSYIADRYALLPHGCSMGDQYGPRLVGKRAFSAGELKGKRVATPGPLTTATLALRLFQPEVEVVHMAFDRVEDAVLADEVDAGMIIHEGQLTYATRGLKLIADMGEWWFRETGLPLPLGGNVVRKDLGEDMIRTVSRHLRDSIAYALDHRGRALDHAMRYARGLDRGTADEFVGMYVNQWTLDYGATGREAVQVLLDRGHEAGIIRNRVLVEFAG